jgi:hypothetical protein
MARQYCGGDLIATIGKSEMDIYGVNDYLRINVTQLMAKLMCIGTTASVITYCDGLSDLEKMKNNFFMMQGLTEE